MFRIPLPDPNANPIGDALKYISALRQQREDRLAKQPLIEAETQKAQADAQKANMISNLINPYGQSNDNQSNLVNSPNQNNQSSMKNSPALGGNINNNPSSNNAKNTLQALGIIKETPAEQQARETSTAWQNALATNDIKQIGKWEDTIAANEKIQPSLENLQQITANPDFKSMYTNPEYFGYDLQYLRRFGTPQQQELLTSFGTNTKNLYSTMGQEFKGSFRKFERDIFDKATPNELTDTLPQIVAKNNTLLQLKDLVNQRLKLADNIVRSSKGTISPSAAMDIADKQIGADKIRKEIQEKQNRLEKQFEEQKKKSKDNIKQNEKSSNLESNSNVVTIIDPSGGEHVIDKNFVNQALAKYPGSKLKEESNAE